MVSDEIEQFTKALRVKTEQVMSHTVSAFARNPDVDAEFARGKLNAILEIDPIIKSVLKEMYGE